MSHFSYEPTATEQKWQKRWQEEGVYAANLQTAKKPFYSMVMFPYPSGDKLHVGHWYNFAPADSYARFKRMQGYDVFSPMGFDAFGLPAENYAIKTGVHPDVSITQNVATMVEQLSRIGCMYDWSRMVNTSKPEYYRWTQWLFLQMHKHGLAYKKKGNVNWCESCQTVLANEQAQDGTCERCGTNIVKKPLEQWYWRTTDYAQQLLDGLEGLDWPEKTKTMQRNWIGRSEGVNFREKVKDMDISFEVYDSIPQTFLAQTFTIIAPEHPLLPELVKGTKYEKDVLDFVENIKARKMAEKFEIEKDMEGIFTGRYVENPFGTGDLPIWVCSYVLADYGTGIVNCSAHDERDFAFAKKFGIPLKIAMLPEDQTLAEKVRNLEVHYLAEDGILQSPEPAKGMRWKDARSTVIDYIEKQQLGRRTVNYRLRDWLVSRQRYWGAPIPIVYDPEGNAHPIPEEHLPWTLPTDVEFKPTGKSPLTDSKEFLERTERIFGKGWRPEFDTMDTFVCSSFYYLRYLADEQQTANSKQQTERAHSSQLIAPDIEKKWLPVSMYIGGPEHACMHLIYARFVMMALKDFGHVSHSEPFKKLVHQGLITNQGAKMSKSKGNVVSPDSFVDRHGADVFRMYLMFMGPFTDGGDWSDTGIKGIDRFVQRLARLYETKLNMQATATEALHVGMQKVIKKVGEDIERLQFNTALSTIMEFLNAAEGEPHLDAMTAQTLALVLSPLAPHFAEELWEKSGGTGFACVQPWPTYDASKLVASTITIAVQVNGKLRGQMDVAAETPEADIVAAAKLLENVAKYLTAEPKKQIYVKGKLVSFVV